MPITQDRFLTIIYAANSLCELNGQTRRLLHGHRRTLREAQLLAERCPSNVREILASLAGVLTAILDAHDDSIETYNDLVALVKAEHRHFTAATKSRNDRQRAKQKQARQIDQQKREGKYIDQFFYDGSEARGTSELPPENQSALLDEREAQPKAAEAAPPAWTPPTRGKYTREEYDKMNLENMERKFGATHPEYLAERARLEAEAKAGRYAHPAGVSYDKDVISTTVPSAAELAKPDFTSDQDPLSPEVTKVTEEPSI